MTRLNWTISIIIAGLLAALIVLALVTMSDALLGMVVVSTIDLEARLKKAEKLLRDFCKATNPNEAYGWVYDEMRRMTSKERKAAKEFLKPAKRAEPKPDGKTPSMEKALHDAGFGSYGPM